MYHQTVLWRLVTTEPLRKAILFLAVLCLLRSLSLHSIFVEMNCLIPASHSPVSSEEGGSKAASLSGTVLPLLKKSYCWTVQIGILWLLAHSVGCDYSNYRPGKVKLTKLNINWNWIWTGTTHPTGCFYDLYLFFSSCVVRVAKS